VNARVVRIGELWQATKPPFTVLHGRRSGFDDPRGGRTSSRSSPLLASRASGGRSTTAWGTVHATAWLSRSQRRTALAAVRYPPARDRFIPSRQQSIRWRHLQSMLATCQISHRKAPAPSSLAGAVGLLSPRRRGSGKTSCPVAELSSGDDVRSLLAPVEIVSERMMRATCWLLLLAFVADTRHQLLTKPGGARHVRGIFWFLELDSQVGISYSSVRWTVGWCLLALWRTWIISVAFMAGCMHRHLYSTVN
jgi:hypothetical protein